MDNYTIENLVATLKQADHEYYNLGNSKFTDASYDNLKDILKLKDPNNRYFLSIGAPVIKSKVSLPYYMGSLDKIKDISKIKNWISNYPIIISDKLDGVSALYDGYRQKLYTRGDGKIGQDISHFIKYIKGFATKDIICRGELILSKSNADILNVKVPRNVVAGIINSKSPNMDILPHIEFISYEIISDINIIPSLQYKILDEKGYKTPNFVKELPDLLVYHKERKDKCEYYIDGLVLTKDIEYVRCVDKNPEYSIAYKSDELLEKYIVEVKDVEWNISIHKYIKPTIIFDPIIIDNVCIKRATGFNGQFIKSNGIGKGALVNIVRGGDVIPDINSVIKSVEPLMPTYRYKWTDSNVDIILDDDNFVDEMKRKEIIYFFEKIKVVGLKEGTVNKLYKHGLKSIYEIINAEIEELVCDGIRENSAKNIYNNIKDAMGKASLLEYMVASNIFGRGIGENKIKVILDAYDGNITYDIKRIDGIGEETLLHFIDNIDIFWNFMKENNIMIPEHKKKEDNGIVVVFSGFRDKKLEEDIVKIGGKVMNAVSKKVNYLIVNDINDNSGKLEKAKSIGIRIIDRDMFVKEFLYNI
jgi:DNA ligase (NAD+)